MKQAEIKLPETINDAPLEVLANWSRYISMLPDELNKDLYLDIQYRLEIVSIFTGKTKSELAKNPSQLINKAFIHCSRMIENFEVKCEPSGVIEIDGKRYVYDKEIHNVSTAQVIDIKLIEDIYKSPYELMAILYVEDGMEYNEEDSSGRIKNTLKERVELFRKHPIGEEFMNMIGFFLDDYIILKAATQGKTPKRTKRILKKAAKRIIMTNGTNGQRT